jgi:hypothetical protein
MPIAHAGRRPPIHLTKLTGSTFVKLSLSRDIVESVGKLRNNGVRHFKLFPSLDACPL